MLSGTSESSDGTETVAAAVSEPVTAPGSGTVWSGLVAASSTSRGGISKGMPAGMSAGIFGLTGLGLAAVIAGTSFPASRDGP